MSKKKNTDISVEFGIVSDSINIASNADNGTDASTDDITEYEREDAPGHSSVITEISAVNGNQISYYIDNYGYSSVIYEKEEWMTRGHSIEIAYEGIPGTASFKTISYKAR